MRTAEEILDKKIKEYGLDFDHCEYGAMLEAMKEYAKSVAHQSLENASKNATYYLDANDEVHIIKSSITNTDNIPAI